jgi:hypothetical protein
VYLLRWYWWRINAWSEITAMIIALLSTIAIHSNALWQTILSRPELFSGSASVLFAKATLTTTLLTSLAWILVTWLTKPEPDSVLVSFYRKVRPQITGWERVAALAPDVPQTHDLAHNLWCWVLGCVMVYAALFGVGKLLLEHWTIGTILVVVAIVCAWQMSRELSRSREPDASGAI